MKRRVHEDEETGELNIVPYLDIVTNLVMFMLLSMVGLFSLGVLDVGTPKLGDPSTASLAAEQPEEPQLTLTVAVSDKGFYVAGARGVLEGPEGESNAVDTTRPPTVPLMAGRYDYAALTALMAKIKLTYPKEQKLILVAENPIPYDVIIQTMDACRERLDKKEEGVVEHQPLFPEVWLSMMR